MISYVLPAANRTIKQEFTSQTRGNKLDDQIIELLDVNAEFFRARKNFDYHPHYYVTLDKIAKMALNVSEMHHSMVRLTDALSGGGNRIVYIYAYLIEEDEKAIVKICLLRPLPERQGAPRDATRMCQKAVEYSVSILDKIVKVRASKLLTVPVDNPEHLLIKNVIIEREDSQAFTKELEIYPNKISFENELHELINTGFRLVSHPSDEETHALDGEEPQKYVLDIEPVPIPHILSDWIEYLKGTEQVLFITDNYHIVNHKENPSLITEEVRRHVLVHEETLKKVILPRIHRVMAQSSNTDYTNAYTSWKEYTSDRENADFTEEAKQILEVMKAVHLDELDESQIGLSIKSIYRLMGILESLFEHLNTSLDVEMSKLSQKICAQIEYNSNSRKLLSLLNLNEELGRVDQPSTTEDLNTLKNLFEELAKRFAYLVKSGDLLTPKDFQDIYFVNPSNLTDIIANLANLTLKNRIFLEQYEVAKKIKIDMLNDIKVHPELDSKISPAEITKANKTIQEVDKILSLEKEKKEAKKMTEYDLVKGFLFSVLSVGTILVLTVVSNPYFIVLLITYPFLIKFFFSKDKAKKKEIVREEETPDVQPDLTQQVQNYIKQNIITNNSEREGMDPTQIMTHNQLDELLDITEPTNIAKLKEAFPRLKDQTPTQIKKKLRLTLLRSMAMISFKDEEVPKGNYMRQKRVPFPRELYIAKNSLSNTNFRRKLSNSFRKEFEMLMPIEKDKQMYYRKLIEILENPKEYTKYLKIR